MLQNNEELRPGLALFIASEAVLFFGFFYSFLYVSSPLGACAGRALIFVAPAAAAALYFNTMLQSRRGARSTFVLGRLLLATSAGWGAWHLAAQFNFATAPAGAAAAFAAAASFLWLVATAPRRRATRSAPAFAAFVLSNVLLVAACALLFAATYQAWRAGLQAASPGLWGFRRCAALLIFAAALAGAPRTTLPRRGGPLPAAVVPAVVIPGGAVLVKNSEGQPYLEKFDMDAVGGILRKNASVSLQALYEEEWVCADPQLSWRWRRYLRLLAAIQRRGEAEDFHEMAASDPVYRALCSAA